MTGATPMRATAAAHFAVHTPWSSALLARLPEASAADRAATFARTHAAAAAAIA